MRKPYLIIGIFCCLFLMLGTSPSYGQFPRNASPNTTGISVKEESISQVISLPFSEESLKKATNLSQITSTPIQVVEEYIIKCLWQLDRKEMAISRARSLLTTTDSSVAHFYLVQFNLIRGNARHAEFHLERSQTSAWEKNLIRARIVAIRYGIPWPLMVLFFALIPLFSGLIAIKSSKKLFISKAAEKTTKPISLPIPAERSYQKTPEASRPAVTSTHRDIKDYSKPNQVVFPGPISLPASNLPTENKSFLIAPIGIFNQKKILFKPEVFEKAQIIDHWFNFLSNLFFQPGILTDRDQNTAGKIILSLVEFHHSFHDFSEDFLPESEIISDADLVETEILVPADSKGIFSTSSYSLDSLEAFIGKLFPFPPSVRFSEPQFAKSSTLAAPHELSHSFAKFSRLNLQNHEFNPQLPKKLTNLADLIFAPLSDFMKTVSKPTPQPITTTDSPGSPNKQEAETTKIPDFNALNWAEEINTNNRIAGIAQSFLGRRQFGKKNLVGISSTNDVSSRAAFAFVLGRKIAESGLKTLIIDGDFANPMLNLFTDTPCINSLKHILKSNSQNSAFETQTEFENLKILPSGSPDHEAQEFMNKGFWQTTLDLLFSNNDIILLIFPPFNGIENSFFCPPETILLGLYSMDSTSSEREFKYWSAYFQKKGLAEIMPINCQTNC